MEYGHLPVTAKRCATALPDNIPVIDSYDRRVAIGSTEITEVVLMTMTAPG